MPCLGGSSATGHDRPQGNVRGTGRVPSSGITHRLRPHANGGEYGGVAGAGWHGDGGEDVQRFAPAGADLHSGAAAGGGGQGGQGDAAGEVGRGLGEFGDGGDLVGDPAGQGVDGKAAVPASFAAASAAPTSARRRSPAPRSPMRPRPRRRCRSPGPGRRSAPGGCDLAQLAPALRVDDLLAVPVGGAVRGRDAINQLRVMRHQWRQAGAIVVGMASPAEHSPAALPPLPLPGATPREIRAALRPEFREEFDKDYRAALEEAGRTLELEAVHDTLEHWRRRSWITREPAEHRRVVRRAAELLSGELPPADEPVAITETRL